ncbi:hypothetical protein OG21DRAFT_402323 [Imleria badia]|nr:hypothetical protein OG21DRAFT_402323 [Imleria badia]
MSLACTCKSLRYVLMDKSALFVWRAARLRVKGMPDCPADLSEQQYARLLFNNNCQGCENRVGNLYWSIHRRYCSMCSIKRLRFLPSCENPIREGGILPTVSLVVDPGMYYLSWQRNWGWIDGDQVEELMEKLRTTSDAAQLLDDMRKQYRRLMEYANKCIAWEKGMRRKRTKIILKRLRHFGFEEPDGIKVFYESAFTSVKPFTDAEWARMYPR